MFRHPLKGGTAGGRGTPATAVARMAGSAALWGCKSWSRTWSFASGPSGAMAPVLPFVPSGRAEKRRAGRARTPKDGRASCSDSLRLFERSALGAHSEFRSAVPCPSIPGSQRSEGTRQVGSFFLLLSLAKQKKRRAAGRTSRPATIPKDARAGNQTSVEQGFDKLSPNGRCHPGRRCDSGQNQPPALRSRRRQLSNQK